ncbi:MAG: HAD family acid phosphatase [Alphaproteobacteria bacterium]|nr:HAD family acid phosphatase [Alphaproteobacteria bacterium]MCL2758244.1 HAD family acid phosphatase [Alphaproteobacteria bacterium]
MKTPAIFFDIDGVTTKKFATPNWDCFGEPNEHMVRVIKSLARDFTIVFITGRWAAGSDKVAAHIKSFLPDIDCEIFCKPRDYPGTTAEYKLATVKELEGKGYEFFMGFDDHSAVVGLLHNHGMPVAHVIGNPHD